MPPFNVVAATFVAADDLTLRAAYMNGGSLSSDPQFTALPNGQVSDQFQLDSGIVSSWTNLVFPFPKGSKLYWGNLPMSADCQITLIFT